MGARARRLASVLRTVPKLDHRLIGLQQELFFFDKASHGSAFFLPRGAHIYNKLVEFLRQEYAKRNYQELITPNIYSHELWKRSGHWEHYEENMIKCDMRTAGEQAYSLKPMNCPAHCLMYKHLKVPHEADLPIRWADFGTLHRNELSGTLIGLTRVRRFQQDDAHIFCTPQQVESEVIQCLDFAKYVYETFDFQLDVQLSLRPEKYMGDSKLWDQAENSLRSAMARLQMKWSEQENDGAFYGPKIDMTVHDVHQRSHQCATIQLDFQLPQRFELQYHEDATDDDHAGDGSLPARRTPKQPVIIHRAILGSIERFIAILAENCEGRWPFWLSPLQLIVIPTHTNFMNYARWVQTELKNSGFMVDLNERARDSFKAQIRRASMLRYNILVIVGEREEKSKSVTCRVAPPPKLGSSNNAMAGDSTPRPITMKIGKFELVLKNLVEQRVKRIDIELLEHQGAK